MSAPDHVLRVAKQRGYKSIDLYVVSGGSNSDGAPRASADLSWKAVGIHTYLVSRPDGWEFNRRDLINRHSDGRHAVQSGLQELEETGLLYRRKERSPGGEFVGWEWFVSERPLSEDQWTTLVETGKVPTDGFSAVGFSDVGKSTPSNEEDEVYRRGSSGSGRRPSRDGRPAEKQNREEVDPESWYREGLELGAEATDLDQERSYHLAVGVTRLLWRSSDPVDEAPPPEKAPRSEYTPWACVQKLEERLESTSYAEALEVVVGLTELREAGDLGGVDPGEPMTVAYLDWSASNGERSLWSRAREVGREALQEDGQQGSLLDELTEEVVADVA